MVNTADWTEEIEEQLGIKIEEYEYQHLMLELPPLRPVKIELSKDDENA